MSIISDVDLEKAAARFWAYAEIPEEPAPEDQERGSELPCWPWLGLIKPKTGEGLYRVQGKTVLAHLMAYELTFGEPEAPVVRYCTGGSCVNPSHMVAPVYVTRPKAPESLDCPVTGCERPIVGDTGLCGPHYRHFAKKGLVGDDVSQAP